MMKTTNYKVHSGGRGKVFATLEEATAYANEILRVHRELVAVTETRAAVTHIYRLSAK